MEPFLAEIAVFPFNFAPKGWAFCDGQILPISQNTALFSLLGTIYGGDGKSNFALPNLQGRAALHEGMSVTGTLYDLGEEGGVEAVTLLSNEMPLHGHTLRATTESAEQSVPRPGSLLAQSVGGSAYQSNTSSQLTNMAVQAVPINGGSQAHNNMQPYLTLNFCIALQGIFPQRP